VDVVLGLVVALVVGVVWVMLMRRTAIRRRLIGAPEDVAAVLDAYRKARWEKVATDAPALLARPSDGGDKTWRPALELALGHALIETDRPEAAIAHLERGLLLQSALRRAHGGSDVPESADAKFRHLLGWAYAETGRTAQARREYRRVLEIADLEMPIRLRVEASLAALG
jgi:Flp pilus assembly protein TadD